MGWQQGWMLGWVGAFGNISVLYPPLNSAFSTGFDAGGFS